MANRLATSTRHFPQIACDCTTSGIGVTKSFGDHSSIIVNGLLPIRTPRMVEFKGCRQALPRRDRQSSPLECQGVGVSCLGPFVLPKMLTKRVYVMLDIYKLQNQYLSLKARTTALRTSKPTIPIQESEGYELTEKTSSDVSPSVGTNEKVVAIKKEWRAWSLASIKNTLVDPSPPRLFRDRTELTGIAAMVH